MSRLPVALTAVFSTFVYSQAAFAADLPRKAPAYTPPPPAPVYNWTGFYVGGNVGYSWGRSSTDFVITDAATGALLGNASGDNHLNGVVGGGQIGYNWQITNWLVGIEADFQGSGQKDTLSLLCAGCGDGPSDITASLEQRLQWFGTVRGRAGVLVTPSILAYATGGFAYGRVKTDGTIAGPTVQGPGSATFSNEDTRTGWTVGGGIEGMFAPNWTAKVEYLYMDLGNVDTGPFATNIIGPVRQPLAFAAHSKLTDNIVRVGINYKFW